jgi:cytosine deaminase
MPLSKPTDADRIFMRRALDEAQASFDSGGLPVGAALVGGDTLLATGANRSMQTNDPTSHAEIDCLRQGGVLPHGYAGTCLYSTLSPCPMCTGAILFFGVPRVVVGERETYRGDIDFMAARGVDVVVLDDPDCRALMRRFVEENRALWNRVVAGDRDH